MHFRGPNGLTRLYLFQLAWLDLRCRGFIFEEDSHECSVRR